MEKPENEMGVLALFAQQCQQDGWEIVSVQIGFPDLVIRDEATGHEYKAELEFSASTFKTHKHDPRGCDLIICWENDWEDCPLTIWGLSGARGQKREVKLIGEEQKELLYLRLENDSLKREVLSLKGELKQTEDMMVRLKLQNQPKIRLENDGTVHGASHQVYRLLAEAQAQGLDVSGYSERALAKQINCTGWTARQVKLLASGRLQEPRMADKMLDKKRIDGN